MKTATKLRWFGACVLIFNCWLIGAYNLSGVPVLLLTFGFAIAFELLVVKPVTKRTTERSEPPPS
jgi:hypothetical protein